VLAKGELKSKLNLTVTGASASAVEAVEKAGGKVTLLAPVAAAA
jgi:large subunit ribosomal protein L15